MSTLFIVTGDALGNVSMSGHFDLDRTCIDDNPISLARSLSLSTVKNTLKMMICDLGLEKAE